MVGKLFKMILCDKMYLLLKEKGLIRVSQPGLVQDKSCLTDLIVSFEMTMKVNEYLYF